MFNSIIIRGGCCCCCYFSCLLLMLQFYKTTLKAFGDEKKKEIVNFWEINWKSSEENGGKNNNNKKRYSWNFSNCISLCVCIFFFSFLVIFEDIQKHKNVKGKWKKETNGEGYRLIEQQHFYYFVYAIWIWQMITPYGICIEYGIVLFVCLISVRCTATFAKI